MRVDLSTLFNRPGEREPFDALLDLGEVKRWGERLFAGPVKVTGSAQNHSGIVEVSYEAEFVLSAVCDRCLRPVTRRERMKFLHTVVLSLNREDNDEYIVVPDGQLELAELVTSDILLELPTSIVCKEDCKGLCPVCGKDLNEGECGCVRQVPDTRLGKLRELLKD